MGSFGDLDLEVNPVQRSKEENQERAFVAASRRKDRSLDARLESANRASMLHKKRTGKALHITKEIVEKEAMYEEVDERYQEKRMQLLKDHTIQLEQQFKQHLIATMAANHPRPAPRVSSYGGIQKMRNLSLPNNNLTLPTNSSFFAQSNQVVAPVSPTATSPSPTNSVFDLYGAPSPSDSSYVQTPGSCYTQAPLTCPPYFNTGLMSPSVSPRHNSFHHISPTQQVHMGPAPFPPRQRMASVPDAFMLQHPQLVAPIQSTPTTTTTELSLTPSPTMPGQIVQDNALPSPALSSPAMTSSSSQHSSGDGLLAHDVQPMQGQANDCKQPIFENQDPDYHDFFNFASTMDDPWQHIPMGNTPFDEFMNLDGTELEMAQPGF